MDHRLEEIERLLSTLDEDAQQREAYFAVRAIDWRDAPTLRWAAATLAARAHQLETPRTHSRYVIVLDRYDDDDNCGDGHEPTSDEEGMEQVAAELQEAIEQTGEPAGFFNVIARVQVNRADEGDRNVSVIPPGELRPIVKEAL